MARPKQPRGNTTPRRYKGGRAPERVIARIGKDAHRTLRVLALLHQRTPEDEAALLLREAIEAAWQDYDARLKGDL